MGVHLHLPCAQSVREACHTFQSRSHFQVICKLSHETPTTAVRAGRDAPLRFGYAVVLDGDAVSQEAAVALRADSWPFINFLVGAVVATYCVPENILR